MIEPILGAFMLGTVPIRNEIVPTTKPVAPIVEIHIPIEKPKLYEIKPIEAPQLEELPKLEPIPIPEPKAPQRAVNRAPAGWYPKGQCTWYVWTKRDVPGWNNASEWKWQAKRDGWTVSSKPLVGAIAWEPGHVAYVEAVHDGLVTVSESNVKGLGVVSYRTVPYREFSYIY